MAKKEQTLTMVEHMNDLQQWVWYAVLEDATPEEAVRWYEAENGLDKEPIGNDNGDTISTVHDVRAFCFKTTLIK